MASTLKSAQGKAETSDQTGIAGELIYEYTLQFTKVTDYGVPLDALLSGEAAPPAAGARIDVAFKGTCLGPKLRGVVEGVDYIHMRADGRVQLHIHADITTDEGKKIALTAGGVAMLTPGSSIGQLRENVALTTSDPDYSWVNPIQVWASGTVDLEKGEVHVKAYSA